METKHNRYRVCAYARVSTDKDDQINSYESQCKYFEEYIKQHDEWIFVGIYADEGITGTSIKKRKQFQKMIRDAENGDIDLILTKEVSRFARNTVDTLTYTRELKRHGVYVMFLNDNINTQDNDGELRLSIMATIAQDESRKTSERVKWGQKRRMEQGVVFGRDLLGYTVKNGKLYLNEEEAEVVKTVFHKFTNEGKGTHVIARELREEGISPKRVKLWSNTVILRILKNEKYVGDLCQKKTYTPDFLTHDKKYNRGEEEKVYIKDHHPDIAIINREFWNRTQAELKRRSPSKDKKTKYSNRYWCSGKLVCGECGSSFVSKVKKLLNGDIYRAWRCIQAANYGLPKIDNQGNHLGCIGKSINDKTLRLLVSYAVNLIIINKKQIKQELMQSIQKVISIQPATIDKKEIQCKIDALKQKKLKIIDLATDGVISIEDMKTQNDLYTEQISYFQKQIMEFDSRAAEKDKIIKQIEDYSKIIDNLLNIDENNEETLKQTLKKAVIYNNSVVIYLNNIPFGIQLYYKTYGRLDSFGVEVKEFKLIDF